MMPADTSQCKHFVRVVVCSGKISCIRIVLVMVRYCAQELRKCKIDKYCIWWDTQLPLILDISSKNTYLVVGGYVKILHERIWYSWPQRSPLRTRKLYFNYLQFNQIKLLYGTPMTKSCLPWKSGNLYLGMGYMLGRPLCLTHHESIDLYFSECFEPIWQKSIAPKKCWKV